MCWYKAKKKRHDCELVWTRQIHMDPPDSVYIWMTHSNTRLCCSTIHKSNLGKPISRLWCVQYGSCCSSFREISLITDRGPMTAHTKAFASGGVSRFSFASNAGRSGGGGGSIRNRPRERRFRNFKSAYINSRVSFLWFCLISISFICFIGNSSRTFVSNVTTHRYKVTSTFPVHIREGSDQRF